MTNATSSPAPAATWISRKLTTNLASLVRRNITNLDTVKGFTAKDRDATQWIDRIPRTAQREYRRLSPQWESQTHSFFKFESPEHSRWRYYFDKCRRLASRHGASLVVVRTPKYYVPPLHPDLHRALEARFGVPIIEMNRDELAAFHPAGFADKAHVSRRGMRIGMRWLADRLPLSS